MTSYYIQYSVHIPKKNVTNSDIWGLTITTSACQPAEHLMQPAITRLFQHP